MNKNRIYAIQKAFKAKNISLSRQAHQIPEEELERAKFLLGTYLADIVFAAIDGIVTTFAIVSGVEGANLPINVILILGVANLFADGFSMGVGNYLGVKSEMRYQEKEKERESWEVQHLPEEEMKEMYTIFEEKGIKGKDLDAIVRILTSDRTLWVDTMMKEELNLSNNKENALIHGVVTFSSFLIAGIVPLIAAFLSYFFGIFNESLFLFTCLFTLTALLGVGIIRSQITLERWWSSSLQVMGLGSLAASIAYFVGYLLSLIIGNV